jgi:hypothetical protein
VEPYPRPFLDLVLIISASPGVACVHSRVLLARVWPSGLFELLSAAAWQRALGYRPDELSGRPLRELMQLDTRAADNIVAALLDETDALPLEVTLWCKDKRRKRFRLHRRFDAYDRSAFVVADELPEERVRPPLSVLCG